MRNLHVYGLGIIWALVAFVCTSVQAQEQLTAPQEPKTKLESFQRQTGTVIIKGYSEIGGIEGLGSVSVRCMEFTDATSGRRQMGIVVEVITGSGRFEKSNRSFIDYDEVELLLKGIDYVSKAKTDVTRLDNFEAVYKTKGNFRVSTFGSSGKQVEAVVESGDVLSVSAFLSLQQLAEFRGLILQAKQKLDSLK